MLQTYSISEIYSIVHYKAIEIMGGHWRYKLTMSLKYIQSLHCNDTAIMGGY